jgi:hypothetical protein
VSASATKCAASRAFARLTIDFDTMSYYFPSEANKEVAIRAAEKKPSEPKNESGAKDGAAFFKKYAGTYKSDLLKSQIEITLSGDRLSFAASGKSLRGSFMLTKTGAHTFEADNAPQKVIIEFKVDADKVTEAGVTVSGQGPFPFKRQ